jgi:UDP-glucose 4-epimerase
LSDGHEVVVVDNLSTGKKENLNVNTNFYLADVRDKERISEIFSKEKPDIVSHHAAQIDVRKSVSDPAFDTESNIMGMINIGESCVKHGVKKIIFSSSGGVMYGECESPAREADIKPPISPYGISKFASELYLNYWKELYGLKYTALRYANVYGPKQAGGEAGVISIFIKSFLEGKQATIFGDGKQKRDYVYVGDVIDANIKALDKGDNDSFNIGTGKATGVNELYDMIKRSFGSATVPKYALARTGELQKSVLDNKKASDVLGWFPKTDLEEGIKETISWFKMR